VREQLLQSLPEVREQLLQSLHEQLSNFLCFTQEERVYNYEDPTARKTMQVKETCFRTLFQLLLVQLFSVVDSADPALFGSVGSRTGIAFTLQDPLSGFPHERILGNDQSVWLVSITCYRYSMK
jgi:hypothetical protein